MVFAVDSDSEQEAAPEASQAWVHGLGVHDCEKQGCIGALKRCYRDVLDRSLRIIWIYRIRLERSYGDPLTRNIGTYMV